MNQTRIKETQARCGAEPDGFWGRKSIAACQSHLLRLMPKPRFPVQSAVASGRSIYGPHGVKGGYSPPMAPIKLPFPLYLYGDSGRPVSVISAHEVVADSLLSVFQRLGQVFPTQAERVAAGVTCFDGCYNPRRMRGGSSWSMHAWAIAIDLDAGRNGNLTSWPARAMMPLEVMECFAAEGWTPAGAFWGRDAMHFQATQP